MPTRWGFHPYRDIQDGQPAGIASFNALMGAGRDLWLTEAGSHIADETYPDVGLPEGNTARQKAQVCALLQFMDAYPVDRLYYYQYWEPDAAQTWDTGLAGQSPTDPWHSIGPVRLAYNVIQQRHC
jgi:hypothetical protein